MNRGNTISKSLYDLYLPFEELTKNVDGIPTKISKYFSSSSNHFCYTKGYMNLKNCMCISKNNIHRREKIFDRIEKMNGTKFY